MLYAPTTAADKRIALRAGLSSGRLQLFPGAFNPLSAKLIQEKGMDGVYISGAVLSADLASQCAAGSNFSRRGHGTKRRGGRALASRTSGSRDARARGAARATSNP